MTKLWRVPLMLNATLYVKADTPEQALELANKIDTASFEFDGDIISDLPFDDPNLPQISLSPCMTGERIDPDVEPEEVED